MFSFFFIQDKDRKKEIAALLGPVPEERFALLVNLGKKITDYAIEKDTGGDGKLSLSQMFFII